MMSRRPLVVFSLLVLAIALPACDVGDVRDLTPPEADADVADPGVDAAPIACVDPVASVGDGEHNAGQACVACHAGNGGPDFTLAGTLYTTPDGAAPLPGATIVVVDADGATLELVSQQNGNFWTSQPVAFPVRVAGSRCPDAASMSGTVSTADCNAGGCHAAGSATGRIHLP